MSLPDVIFEWFSDYHSFVKFSCFIVWKTGQKVDIWSISWGEEFRQLVTLSMRFPKPAIRDALSSPRRELLSLHPLPPFCWPMDTCLVWKLKLKVKVDVSVQDCVKPRQSWYVNSILQLKTFKRLNSEVKCLWIYRFTAIPCSHRISQVTVNRRGKLKSMEDPIVLYVKW